MRLRFRLFILATLTLLFGLVVSTPAQAQTDPAAPVFINELHYDNAGTDAGEFVEVAGPAGTDLSGWTIVLYNGNGGAPYATATLAGTVPDQDDGFGVVSVPLADFGTSGIQNGEPDGLALVGPAGLVEFLSYEGSFTASGGPADGSSSTDIGVSEPSDSPVGSSLAKTGTGALAGDFAWQAPAADSPGSVNVGQDFVGGPTGPSAPVLNEIGVSDASTDNEFVEILGDADTDYSAYSLLSVEGDGTGAGTIDAVVPIGTTDAGGLFTVNPAPAFENGGNSFLLVEGFTGSTGDDIDTDNDATIDAVAWTTIVDSVAIDDGDAGDLHYGTPVLDESFDDARLDNPFAPGGLSRIPDGADTDTVADWYRNDFDWDGATNGSPEPGEALNTPGASNAIVTAPAPDILINEVDADTDGTDVAEFVELTDGGIGSSSLDGLVLVLFNGSGDTSYQAFDLDGLSTGTDGYFVVCGNAANVAGCDLDVTPESNLVQNGADAVALYQADAAAFPAGTAITVDGLVDAVVYGTNDGDDAGLLSLLVAGGQLNESANGLQTTQSSSRCPDGSGQGRDTTAFATVATSPGAANTCDGGPGPELQRINEIQGAGDASPLVGLPVIISGIVVGDFQEIATGEPTDEPLDGFFVQEEDADSDADPSTSEGIFVFAPGGAAVSVGDLVEVTGTVVEFFGLTEIGSVSDITVVSSGNPLPSPATPTVPTSLGDTPVDWEAIEGMSVAFSQPLFATDLFPLGAYGEVGLSATGPFDHPNQVAPVGSAAAADVRQLNLISKVLLDDGEDENESFPGGIPTWNPTPTPYLGGAPLGAGATLRAGDVVTDLFGVVHYAFSEFEVQPVNVADPTDPDGAVQITRIPRPAAVPDVGGGLTVASFNVLNYFVTLDQGGAQCGPPGNEQGCRGADNQTEFDLQSAKIADAIADLDADIVGLIELENSANDEAIADLVAKVNALSARTYDYVPTGYIGTDAIAVGFIYDPAAVALDGGFAVLDSSVSPAFIDNKSRPALAQTFTDLGSGENMTIAVNHLKSKGSACDDVANPGDPAFGVAPYALGDDADVRPLGDPLFTGNCNLTRTAAARVLGQWITQNPTGTPSDNLLILGDLNAYANEDPITELESQGYADLNEASTGSNAWADGGHSYVFDGEFGTLDYAMANPAMAAQVTGAAAWHINADEPFAIDYQDFNPSGQASPDEWKSSDHDPVIIGLDLAPAVPSCNGVPATIVGTEAGERLIGTSGADVIVALGGDDIIWGHGGNDVICAGDGADRVFGGEGVDLVLGEGGGDWIHGGFGGDELDGGDGADRVFGGLGADRIGGGADDDWLYGGVGGDELDGGDGHDFLNGGADTDTCTTGEVLRSCEL